MAGVLVDAGPLVALVHQDDHAHERCVTALKFIREPLFTVWPALTEAMHLLSFSWKAQDALWEMIEIQGVSLLPLRREDEGRARELMRKYRDLPMDVADAALLCVAERERINKVFTLDRRDFHVYRPWKGGRFVIVP